MGTAYPPGNHDAMPDTSPAQPDPLPALRATYPGYEFTREPGSYRGPEAQDRYIAHAGNLGLHPHTVITADLCELRAALSAAAPSGSPGETQ